MTNKEWLDYLAANAPDELAAWFDAERVTNQAEMLHMPESHESATIQQIRQVIESTVKRGVYGDTAAENADSRELLDADMAEYLEREWYMLAPGLLEKMGGWLDRQAAITQHEITERWAEHLHPIERECGDLRRKVAELTAERVKLRSQICKLEDDLVRTSDERDNWKANCEDWKKDCERYREKFGKCLDYADAIHALMDEGMA